MASVETRFDLKCSLATDQKLKVRFGNISLLVLGGRAHTTHSDSVGQFLAAAQNESILIGSHFYFKFGNTLAQLERGVAELAYAHSSIVFNLRSRAAATKAPDCFFFKLNLRGVERVKIKSHAARQ